MPTGPRAEVTQAKQRQLFALQIDLACLGLRQMNARV